jgi:hypothetical protein
LISRVSNYRKSNNAKWPILANHKPHIKFFTTFLKLAKINFAHTYFHNKQICKIAGSSNLTQNQGGEKKKKDGPLQMINLLVLFLPMRVLEGWLGQ